MDEETQLGHWQHLYAHQDPEHLSWFQPVPAVSIELIEYAGIGPTDGIIDIGGGASLLVDALQAHGYTDLSVLDLSANGLRISRDRLGLKEGSVEWLNEDVTAFIPTRRYAFWHDRAVFHFLTDEIDRALYAAVLDEALEPWGWAAIGTFAPDGPDQCSGLPAIRYDGSSLLAELGPAFHLERMTTEVHRTPGGVEQRFCWSLLRKR